MNLDVTRNLLTEVIHTTFSIKKRSTIFVYHPVYPYDLFTKMLTNQQDVILDGAQGETRTLTVSLPADFESAASTIPPLGH